MNKTLLLLATLGSFGALAGPAAAGDYARGHLGAPPSFGIGVFVHSAPKIVRHHHPGAWQLRPQPVFRFADPWPLRQSWRPSPVRHFGHLPPTPQFRHFPPRHHFGHLPPRPHLGHFPPRPHVWHKAPHSSWRQPWQRLPHHVVRPPHRDHSWRHGGRQWNTWPRRDFADRRWQHRPGADWRHRGSHTGPGLRHVGQGGRRH